MTKRSILSATCLSLLIATAAGADEAKKPEAPSLGELMRQQADAQKDFDLLSARIDAMRLRSESCNRFFNDMAGVTDEKVAASLKAAKDRVDDLTAKVNAGKEAEHKADEEKTAKAKTEDTAKKAEVEKKVAEAEAKKADPKAESATAGSEATK